MLSNQAFSRLKFFGLGVVVLLLVVSLCGAFSGPSLALAQEGDTTLSGYVLSQQTEAISEGQSILNPVANQDLNLSISLKVSDYEGLQQLAADLSNPKSANYRQWLTPAQFAARFSPSQADYDQVVTYFKSHGFQVTQTYANRLGLNVKASSSQVSRTLRTNFVGFEENSKRYFSVNANPTLPSVIASKVQFISGLTDYYNDKVTQGVQRQNIKDFTDAAAPGFRGYSPTDLRKAYNAQPLLDAGANGSGTTVGILLFQSYFEQAELDAFSDRYGLPHVTVKVVGDLQDPNNKDLYEPAVNVEALLDIETSHGAAPNANIILYTARAESQNDSILTLIFKILQEFANDNKADVTNGSFGISESFLPSDFVIASSQLMLQGAVQGTSEFFSSGDNGLYGEARFTKSGGDINKEVAEFPSTFPFATSVGGTRLNLNSDGSIQNETAWSIADGNAERESSGGGKSIFFRRPFYQTGFHSNLVRTIPDISAVADPDTGYSIAINAKYIGGPDRVGFIRVGGTSGSSPLWTGYTALLAQVVGGRLGPLNPLVYDLNFTVFRDITGGNNGTTAIPGYDAVTGLGTPDLLKLITYLPGRSYQTPLPPLATFFERVNPNVSVRPGGKIQVVVGLHNYSQDTYTNPTLVVPIAAGLTLENARFTQPGAYVTSASATEARVSFGTRLEPNQTVTGFFLFDVAASVPTGTVVTHRSKISFGQGSGQTSYTSNQIDLTVGDPSTTDLTQDGFFQGKLTTDPATGDLVLTDNRLGYNEAFNLWYNTNKGTTYSIPAGLVTSIGETDKAGVATVRINKGKWAAGQYTLVVYGRVTGTTLLLSFTSDGSGALTPLSLTSK